MLRQVEQTKDHRPKTTAKEICLCILSAVLLILSFPIFNLEYLAWVSFVPLFFVLRNKSRGKAFLFSYLTGVVFWLGVIYWLIHVTLPGMIVLVLYLSLYFGLFGLIISTYDIRHTTYDLLFFPSIWVLLEYLRSHLFSGFPWALLGYSQYLNLPVIQIADITGVWGVSFLIMMVNVSIYLVLSQKSVRSEAEPPRRGKVSAERSGASPKGKSQKSGLLLITVVCMLFVLCYGYFRLYYLKLKTSDLGFRISVVQGNIPQRLKWHPAARDFIMNRYLELTKEAAPEKADLIIWPEAAIPAALEEGSIYYRDMLDFSRKINTDLLFGAVTVKEDFYFNSAILLSKEGKLVTQYDKLHLVPFGEYIPLRKVFGFLEQMVPIGDFSRGKEYVIFRLKTIDHRPEASFSVLICFEDLFPELSRNFVKKGAGFLVNITNDAWFGKTSSPYQHLQASVFRAVENHCPVIRAANTGVSGFIAASGKIISLVQDDMGENIFLSGYRTEEISISNKSLTLYTRFGDFFIVLCFLVAAFGVIRQVAGRRR